jgi:hydrogenase maturation factor
VCLGEVLQVLDVSGSQAVARRGDGVVTLSLLTVDEPVATGDWVLAHSGFVLERLSPAAAADALALRESPSTPGPPDPRGLAPTSSEETT